MNEVSSDGLWNAVGNNGIYLTGSIMSVWTQEIKNTKTLIDIYVIVPVLAG